MRIALVLTVAAQALACSSEPLVPSTGAGIDATYTIAQCHWLSEIPPCITYLSGVSQHYLDSARLVLRHDGTGTWMAATRTQSCPVGQPCQSAAGLVERSTTYRILPNVLRVFLLNTGSVDSIIEFKSHIPASVPRTWTGPDTLQFGQAGGTTHPVTFGRVM